MRRAGLALVVFAVMAPAVACAQPASPLRFAAPAEPESCAAELAATGLRTRPWPLRPTALDAQTTCEAPGGVVVTRGATGVRWTKPPRVNCAFALRLAKLEAVVQEEAERAFGRRVQRIEQLGTYNCRKIAAYPDWVSEHAFANAIDVAAFVLRGGKKVVVERDWVRASEPATRPASEFLQRVARRLYDEGVFSVVLTPSFDAHHRNHFHLDGAAYRVDGT